MRIFGAARQKPAVSAVPIAPNRLRFGRTSAVLGILWQPARQNVPLRNQAAIASGPHGEFDLYLSFGRGKQHGFATTGEGAASGMLAGATMFESSRMSDAWLGAFPLGAPFPHWWVVSVRDGQIYEDRVLSGESQARSALEKILDAPGWERIIAPAAWRISSTEQAELGELISMRSAIRLRSVNRAPAMLLWASAAAVAVAAAVYGWQKVQGFREERQWRTIAENVSVPARKEIPRPWANAPRIERFVEACVAEMDNSWMQPPGWNISRATCARSNSGASLRFDFRNAGGGAHFMRSLSLEKTGIEPEFSSNLKRASLIIRVPIPQSGQRAVQSPWSRARVESALQDRFNALGLEVSLVFRRSGINARGDSEEISRHDISLATSVGVREYAQLLSDVPAVVPESLAFEQERKVWKLTAKAFHANSSRISEGKK
ncbi:MAG: type 4b pilus protein PilO2 [Albidovulum sp.]|nr:type 4b pilus protein PilO2 [Albidovulum sp.]